MMQLSIMSGTSRPIKPQRQGYLRCIIQKGRLFSFYMVSQGETSYLPIYRQTLEAASNEKTGAWPDGAQLVLDYEVGDATDNRFHGRDAIL